MKKITSYLAVSAAAFTLFTFSACKYVCLNGSGHMTTETRKVENFTKLDIAGGFKVNLKQDSSLNVTVTADDNLQKDIMVKVSNGKLRIYNRKPICNSGELTLNIGVRSLEAIKATGAVELQAQGKLNVHDLKMNYAGATKVTLDVNAANIQTEGTGATEIHLSGQAASHKINLSGSGKLYAFDCVTGGYDIITSGASECQINVLKSLNVRTSGASEIQYKGSPSEINNKKSGASSITKVD